MAVRYGNTSHLSKTFTEYLLEAINIMNTQIPSIPIFYALLVFSILLMLIIRKRNSSKPKRLPPGPPKLPIVGNLHQLRDPLHKSLIELSKQHGDLMFLQFGFAPSIVISSADVLREVIKSHDLAFSGRPDLHVPSTVSYGNSDVVFSPYGEHWREIKKIAVLELLSAKRVQTFQAVRYDEVSLLVDSIALSSGPVDVSKLLHAVANNVICRIAFGRKFIDGRKSPQEMLQETQDLIGTICLSDVFPLMGWLNKLNGFDARLEKNFGELNELFDKVIEEHLDPNRSKPDHEDVVDVLLRLRKESKQSVTVTDKFIKALISDMFIAGTDTSSATLVWAMTELIRNPTTIQKAQEEVRRVAKGKDKVEESDLAQLTYLKSVVKETLRFHTPSPLLIPRETMENCDIRGYNIPANTRVFINATALSMDPRSWENPHEFRPERFLNTSIDFRGQHFEFIPFGVGRRMCPGANFALPVIELVLSNLLYRFDWELPPGVTRETMNVDEALGFTVLKKTPLILVARPASL